MVAEARIDHDRILRRQAGLLDRSERGRLALTGGERREFLQGQVTNDIEALAPGEGCYAAFLTHKGKMLGDLRVLETGDELLLDCERPALQELFGMIRRYKLGRDVELHKRTLESGLLSLIGPRAREIAGGDPGSEEHAHAAATIAGAPVRLIATDGGLDVLVADSADTERVRAALLAAGAQEVPETAAEVLRVESGRPRWGHELDETVIPQEAGLNERAVSFTKGCYVGQETVARLHYKGKPNRHLRGLKLGGGEVAPGDELRLGEKVVGRVATVVDSPRHGPIALALVRREAEPGAVLRAGGNGAEATVAALPF